MNILFLDIDGVLNSARTRTAFGYYPMGFSPADMGKFDHVAVSALRNLCRAASVSIVLSSSWREDFDSATVARALDLPVIASAPIHRDGSPRGAEIAAWLAGHPEVRRYCIVDDADDFLPTQREFLVTTDADEGLTYRALVRIARHFGITTRQVAMAAGEGRPPP